MKKLKESIVISAMNKKTVYHKVYVCEICGMSYQDKELIQKCPICGKDMCVICEKEPHLFDEDILVIDDKFKSLTLRSTCTPYKYLKVCKSCFKRLRSDAEQYLADTQVIVARFNQDIANLTKKFIEEHKEPKDEIRNN